jgi:2-oxoglutarate ferredoxin oxidoreductase subunit beta
MTVTTPAWCPGCGDHIIRLALIDALKQIGRPAQDTVLVSGIGQAAKMPQYIPVNYFNGLHGRSLPAATGIKLARPELTVVAVSGDGCMYGEGGNHFIHTIRRNLDLTILICNNRVYALTKGQSSPTTPQGIIHPLSPQGTLSHQVEPLALALVAGAPFVARGFAGDREQLTNIFTRAIQYPGTAVVDIFQPCVSFNKENTYQWYKERVVYKDNPYPDYAEALAAVQDRPFEAGVLYQAPPAPRKIKSIFQKKVTDQELAGVMVRNHQ